MAQMSETDSLVYKVAVGDAITSYHDFLGSNASLYNGIEYVAYPLAINEGHPFFLFDRFDTATVIYDGVPYHQVRLLFDLAQDVLVVEPPFQGSVIQLYNERIKSFTLFGHNFVRIVDDSARRESIATGFYEVLYSGKSLLLRKDNKDIEQNLVYDGMQIFIREKINYYLLRDGSYHPINNKKELLNLMSDRKKEIRQFLRKNKIRLRKDMDDALVRAVAFYDRLPR